MDDRQKELSIYRLQQAEESLKASRNCLENGFYKDSINRSYYSAFYAIKAVLALGTIDFKRHKDVIAYFNKEYVATEIFPRELGRRLGTLKQLREKSDYDDFYITSKEKAMEQIETAEIVLQSIKGYLAGNIE
ncbi:MAG: HEPN domain-containing protein [Blautia sp.]|nr:HEPN domain-containing protein [Blautia sp.]